MLQINFTPFPVLKTERLILRNLHEKDVARFFDLRSNPENMQYIPRNLHQNFEDTKAQMEMINSKRELNEGINWVITTKESDEFMGVLGLYRIEPENFRAELGYMILPQFCNNGYVTEALKSILDFGFNSLQLHSIEAIIDPNNSKSERVLQKLLFQKEAHIIENLFFNGKFWDTVIYSMLKKNYIASL
jgi:ribosomal-protein-alanine N-acetyltransferase